MDLVVVIMRARDTETTCARCYFAEDLNAANQPVSRGRSISLSTERSGWHGQSC